MNNMNEPENQGHSDPESHSLENKVSALERQIAEQQDRLRDYEKSLVERIGDVDDDRRMTASKLKRAWQSQLEEIDERLRRQMAVVFGALVLFLVLVGVVLFFVYHQANSDRQLLADELAELKQDLSRLSVNPAEADSVRAELDRLSAAVNEITTSSGPQDAQRAVAPVIRLEDERIARKRANEEIDAKIQRLEIKLEGLMWEIQSLREAQKNPRTTMSETARGLSESPAAVDIEQASNRASAAATGETPAQSSPTSPTGTMDSPEETTAAAAQQPLGNDTKETLTATSPEGETSKTLVVADDSYALQLIGFYSFDGLLRFAERSDLPQRLYYRKETVEGRPWYALIHSLYGDYAAAEAQLQNLPPELVAMKPWIRPFQTGVELTVLDTGSRR